MKVLLIDSISSGHHIPYAKALGEAEEYEAIYLTPKEFNISNSKNKQIIMKNNPYSFKEYLRWIKEIESVANKEKVDIIHFLYGDILYKFLGVSLNRLKQFKVIATFHQIRRSLLRDFSRKVIFNKITYGVVHTKALEVYLKANNITNIKQIEYPCFNELPCLDVKEAKAFFGIKEDEIVIGAIGGTRYDKGLDILLDAMELVDRKFKILIAGKAESFSEEYIKEKTKGYEYNVKMYIKFLDENELNLALNSVDILVLPYRKIFDGASGPLSEGVWLGKGILGSDHGSLGELIRENKLGLTFKSENIVDLSEKITYLIENGYECNEKSEEYRKKLNVKYFKRMYNELYLKCLNI